MYIVAIGWAYVILMMALTSSSLERGLTVLFFLGILPLALFALAFGLLRRRRPVPTPDEMNDQREGRSPQTDQDDLPNR
mgnify:CR=1 FL=1